MSQGQTFQTRLWARPGVSGLSAPTYLFYHSFPVKVATLIPEDLQLP